MSVNNELHEMENQVTKGAKAADPMPKAPNYVPGAGSIEDLGGPTPTNSRPDDGSNKLKTPSATLAQKGDPHFKNADAAHTMPGPGALKSSGYGRGANEEVEAEELNLEEDVAALLEGEDLSDEFQEKAKTVFEAVVRTRIAEAQEAIEAQYEQTLVEQVEAIKTELTERVDGYLEYVAQEWLEENQLAIEHGLKTEMTESFLNGMKSLFEEHYVSIPEEKYDVIESMVDKLDEMESKLNEQIERNIGLNRRLAESSADVIFAEVAEGLAVTQKEKLASLAENVEFDSEETYREKLVTLRNSYFSESASSTQREAAEAVVESTEEQTTTPAPEAGSIMEAYLQTLSRVAKK